MVSVVNISIVGHTTASSPNLHVLYILRTAFDDGQEHKVLRRYSQFVKLQAALGDPFTLPPKRQLANVVVPSTWIDDQLISERKTGLTAYLNSVNAIPDLRTNKIFMQFLTSPLFEPATPGDCEPLSMVARDTPGLNCLVTNPQQRTAPIAAAYYPAWSTGTNPPNKIDFSKFDILFFAFVTPNASSTITWDDDSQDALRKLTSAARTSGKGTKIVLSIGGWGGSHWFSQATSNSSNRYKLSQALVNVVHTYSLDGIDIDWEYPNSPGAGNPYAPADSANFLSLLKLLRTSLGPSKVISAAVAHMPWIGPDGSPLTDVREFAAQVTYVNIMNYDVYGASTKPGPNAPLGNLCGTSSQPLASAQAALAQWTKAGMPASKILLGLPLYGYVCRSTAKKLSGSLVPGPDPSVLLIPHPRSPLQDISSAPAGDLSGMWGQQISFNQLLSSGVLVKKDDGTYTGANGYTMSWDNCSDTPFLYNVSRSTVVVYDDTWSLASKTKFARKSGMAGCFTWSLDQDDGFALQNVICVNLGKK